MFPQMIIAAALAIGTPAAKDPGSLHASLPVFSHVTSMPATTATVHFQRPSAREIKAAVRENNATRSAARTSVLNVQKLGVHIEYPSSWSARAVRQPFARYENDASATEERIAIFSAPSAKPTEQGTDTPYLPAFTNVLSLVADYTDLNTVSLSMEKLDEPMELSEVSDGYYYGLTEIAGHDTHFCECDLRLAQRSTRFAYSTEPDGSTILQAWSIVSRPEGDTVYMITAHADARHHDEILGVFYEMVDSFRVR